MMMQETETQIRMRRAKDALLAARELETATRQALNDAVQASARAKARYEELFLLNDREERQRLMEEYRHATV